MPTPESRAYLLQVLLLTSGLLGATALFNKMTDPYGIYNTFNRVGANAQKPGQKGHDRLVKAYALRARCADVLLLGTSRVQYGMNPDDPTLQAFGKRPYNGALLGSNIYLALRYLQHAEAISHVRLAIVGLDPLMFDDGNSDAIRDFSESRLAVSANNTPQRWGTWTDVPSTLLSMDTTRLSVRTWRKQSSIVSDLTTGGQRSVAALKRLYGDGADMMERFLSVDAQYAKDYAKAKWPKNKEESPSLLALQQLLDFALAHDIRLELYLTPEHVHLHEVAKATGNTEAIAGLTTLLAQQVEAAQARAALPHAITLWDFATLNSITTEAVPQSDDATPTPMQWFWEPTHAKDTLGHLVLTRMLEPNRVDPEGLEATLGEPLTVTRTNDILAKREQALQQWEASHLLEVQSIRARIADTKGAATQP